MSAELERPERYMLGDQSASIIPADVAAWLVQHASLRQLRTRSRGADPRRDAVLMALTLVGMRASTEAHESDRRKSTQTAPESEWMNTTQVADRLGLSTTQRVTQLIRGGELAAERDGRAWRIHRTELTRYLAAKAA